MKIRMISALAFTALLASCGKEEWEGFVYPNKNDLTVHRNIGIYESLESCRSAA